MSDPAHPTDPALPGLSGSTVSWRPPDPGLGASGRAPEVAPRVLGYEIRGPLGRGGMGVVWRAYDKAARREVALKQLAAGGFDPGRYQRFEREVELAASLQHPNVARVYHSGLRDGLYYYTMELVEGVTLDRYVGQGARRGDRRAVLGLMSQVCQGVQHAHFKLIIHRDLKPSNIMVGADGSPRVLDFGLAKLMAPDAEGPEITTAGATAGTLAYMSPEQAAGSPDLDFRSDVYSLGKVLFELLTGHPAHPLDGPRHEVRRRVAEDAVRRPRALAPGLDRDLEALLLKALHRDPARRYGSAGELGRDIDNYLRGDPLAAKRQTALYVVGKRLRKHRVLAATVAAALAAVATVGAGAYVRITREVAGREASDRAALREAHRNVVVTRKLGRFLNWIDPTAPGSRERTAAIAAELRDLDRDVSAEFADDPLSDAMVREAIGANLLAYGQFDASRILLERAIDLRRRVPPPAPQGGWLAQERLAEVYRQQGRLEDAAALCQAVYADRANELGEAHRDTLRAANTLARAMGDCGRGGEALTLARAARERCAAAYGPRDPDATELADTLACVLRDGAGLARAEARRADAEGRQGDARKADARADADLREATVLAERNLADRRAAGLPGVAVPEACHTLASALSAAGRLGDAVAHYRDALRLAAQNPVLMTDHPDVVIWKNDLAYTLALLGDAGQMHEAEEIFREIVGPAARLRGERHRYTAIIWLNYVRVLAANGKQGEAEAFCRGAVGRLAAPSSAGAAGTGDDPAGPVSPQSLGALEGLGWLLANRGNWPEAAGVYRRAYEARKQVQPPYPREVVRAAHDAGCAAAKAGDLGAASTLLREAADGRSHLLGPGHPDALESRRCLDEVLRAQASRRR